MIFDGHLRQDNRPLLDCRQSRLQFFLEKSKIKIKSDLRQSNEKLKSKSTLFCAVFSKDPDRYELLRVHYENVSRIRTSPVPLYIFEDNDKVPDYLVNYSVVLDRCVTIYEAWRVATGLCNTEFVGNLNLDDRFVVNGFEVLENALEKSGADIIGGEWLINIEGVGVTDPNVFQCTSKLGSFRRITTWPPELIPNQILGSGVAQKGSLGPGTLWKTSIHNEIDYPTYFLNGQKIRSIGDSEFWKKIYKSERRIARLPAIIGVYNSCPSTQAEFRAHEDVKHLALSKGAVI
ncbi:MAG: glycosyltransferase family 2 protein [Gammaproteobacteria bacterium]